MTVSTQQKIRYSDCDPQGIVFNGNYARYWDDAMTDWIEDAGYGGPELGGIGVDVVAARMEIDFKASVRLGDVIETTVSVGSLGNTSMTLGFVTTRMSDGAVVASGREVIVFVDPEQFRPVRIPDDVRKVLGAL
ncbi:MAG: thioesterase family protein [Acidimicrobiia bacterium]